MLLSTEVVTLLNELLLIVGVITGLVFLCSYLFRLLKQVLHLQFPEVFGALPPQQQQEKVLPRKTVLLEQSETDHENGTPPAVPDLDDPTLKPDTLVPPPLPPPQGLDPAQREAMGNLVKAVLIVFLAIWLGLMLYRNRGGSHGHEGLSPSDVFGQVQEVKPGVRYYLPPAFVNAQRKQVPVMSCVSFPSVGQIHNDLLGPALKPASGGSGGPREQSVQPWKSKVPLATPYAVDTVRADATGMCIFERDTLEERFDLTEAKHQGHLDRPLVWELTPYPPVQDMMEHGQPDVRQVLLLPGRAERYYRVLWVQPQRSGTPKYRLAPVLVSESHLLDTVGQWYDDMLERADKNFLLPDKPILCPEHLGIVGSHMLFYLDETNDQWHLWLQSRIQSNLSDTLVRSQILYSVHLPFPQKVDAKYGVTFVSHAPLVRVQYLEMTNLFDTPAGREELKRTYPHLKLVEPTSGPTEDDDEEGENLPSHEQAQVVDLAYLIQQNPRSMSIFTKTLDDRANYGTQHCLALARRVREQMGLREEDESDYL